MKRTVKITRIPGHSMSLHDVEVLGDKISFAGTIYKDHVSGYRSGSFRQVWRFTRSSEAPGTGMYFDTLREAKEYATKIALEGSHIFTGETP